jgi:hypothetical protein
MAGLGSGDHMKRLLFFSVSALVLACGSSSSDDTNPDAAGDAGNGDTPRRTTS